MVREAQREAELSPSDLPHRVAGYGGTVQPQPDSMLQELQLRRASQAEGGVGADGPHRGGSARSGGLNSGGGGRGGGVGENSDGESETAFPFLSTHLTRAVPPSPLLHEGSTPPRESPSEIRRGSGAQMEAGSEGVVRPGVGQRSPSPTSPTKTLEAVAPELLAKTSWVDLNAPLPTPDSVDKYRTIRKASTTAHLLNLLSSHPASTVTGSQSSIQLIEQAISAAESPLPTSNSNTSEHSQDSASTATSNASAASSFAYHIRHGSPDLRLFKQRSKPTQHTIQKPSGPKVPRDLKHSPTLLKPKIISDTAIVILGNISASPTALPAPVVYTSPEMMLADSVVEKSIGAVQNLALPINRKPLPAPPTDKEDQEADRRRPSTAARDFPSARPAATTDPATRQLRFESPIISGKRNGESPPSAETSRKSSMDRSRGSSTSGQHKHHRRKKQYHAVTPPEEEPHVRPLHHGDSYFQTFHTLPDELSKEFVPVQTPPPMKEDFSRRRPESEPVQLRNQGPCYAATHRKTSSESTAIALPKKRKQSSMFSFLRKSAFSDQVSTETHDGSTPLSISTGTSSMPGTLLISADEGRNRRRLSSVVPEMQIQSYFNRARVRRLPSDNTLSPMGLPTPLSAFSDDLPTPVTGRPRSRQQNRSSSEQLSPLGTPRARHRPTLESLRSRVSQTTIRVAPTSAVEVRRASTNKSKSSVKSTLKGKRKNSVKFVDEVGPGRVEPFLLDRSQAPLKSKPSNYFVDIRKVSSAEQLQSECSSAIETKWTRRWSLVPKLSLVSLSKISLGQFASFSGQRLRNKSSQLSNSVQELSAAEIESELESPISQDPAQKGGLQPSVPLGQRFTPAQLEVTEFEQTPYSQRYHDSERALKQQIRAFVDEGLNEGDDAEGDDELVLGFEHDVPDHFPTSPLCPLSPKHKSGGKAICPLHGRYKKGVLPPMSLGGRRGRGSSSAMDHNIGHHRIKIVLDTAEEEAQPVVKDGDPLSVDIFGVLKEDARIQTKTSILGIDGAISIGTRTRATTVYSMQAESLRGRTRERDLYGSERKRRRRVRLQCEV